MLLAAFSFGDSDKTDTTLDSTDLIIDGDGNWEVMLSATRPDQGNWIRIDKHSLFLLIRNSIYDWNNEIEPSVQVEVIGGPASADLGKHLPDDTSQVSPEERNAVLARRMAGYNRRTNPAGL